MIPKRPASVSESATLVYPGQSFQPGIGVQVYTLQSMQKQIDHANSMADLNYARALSDWNQNAPIYAAYHMQGPPQPLPPPHASLKIVWCLCHWPGTSLMKYVLEYLMQGKMIKICFYDTSPQ